MAVKAAAFKASDKPKFNFDTCSACKPGLMIKPGQLAVIKKLIAKKRVDTSMFKLPVTSESLTKQCNDKSFSDTKKLRCVNDPSHGFGSKKCLECQLKACAAEWGHANCWKCNLLKEGSSIGFSCARLEENESTICKALITDETTQPWIGSTCLSDQDIPDRVAIEGIPQMGNTSTNPFPLLKEVQCTKIEVGKQTCSVQKINPCSRKDTQSNMCKMGEDQISLTKAF